MDNAETAPTVPEPQLQFLDLDHAEYGALSAADRALLGGVCRPPPDRPRPGDPGAVWTTPRPPVEEEEGSVGIEFGCASEVFNSIAAGNFDPSLSVPLVNDLPAVGTKETTPGPRDFPAGPPALPAAPPELPAGPVPVAGIGYVGGSGAPQHIHINNFTANLTYHTAGK